MTEERFPPHFKLFIELCFQSTPLWIWEIMWYLNIIFVQPFVFEIHLMSTGHENKTRPSYEYWILFVILIWLSIQNSRCPQIEIPHFLVNVFAESKLNLHFYMSQWWRIRVMHQTVLQFKRTSIYNLNPHYRWYN